jgi:predicted amidohydrolase
MGKGCGAGAVKVAAIQMNSSNVVEQNLAQAGAAIEQAARTGARLVVLPENFSYMGARDADRLAASEAPGDGPAQRFLYEQARAHAMYIVGGTIPMRGEGGRSHSRSLLMGPDGAVLAAYDKIHLFDVDIPDNAKENYRESDTTIPGTTPVVGAVDDIRVGMSICYDLRFPALFHRLGMLGMEIIVVPAAFTVPTGRVHWLPLLRARAIEALAYVVAAGQWGEHAGGRLTYGHSAILSPWGEVLASMDAGIGAVSADLDFDQQRELRAQFPVLTHRREL